MAEQSKTGRNGRSAVELAAEKAAASPSQPVSAAELKARMHGGGSMRAQVQVSRPILSPEQLGAFVAVRRKAKRLSQQDFGDLAGVGRRFVSELEGGKETAQIGKVMKVLQALGIDLVVRER